MDAEYKVKLPGQIERLLAEASIYFERKGRVELQRLVVNAHCYVDETTTYDNWNGGTYGHTVHLRVPRQIYYEVFDDLDEVRRELGEALNKLANVDSEYFDAVFVELIADDLIGDWREKSGLLMHNIPLETPTSDGDLQRLWKAGFLRVFLSHKSTSKLYAAQLKNALERYGITCFVAHEDIEPSKPWQDEIEKALFSMHVLVPLLTLDFHQSNWTDQEIGVAIGRNVPVLSLKLGADPYGFIGKYQAIASTSDFVSMDLPKRLVRTFLEMPLIQNAVLDGLAAALKYANSFAHANELASLLFEYAALGSNQTAQRFEDAFQANMQVRAAYDVQKLLPDIIARWKSKVI